ncbi:hypothetical protein GOBAR_AA11501 [Gossypium barbadense]|uniref:UBA domain-containing protein n=1 Tax=Gossypium barbadense TaxID=3634 RepID=A0A2P5Y0M3_GOSBA|nr:hypothetical protein GOBAR_AA11501 [Gossypium barbadense]
MAGVSLKCGDCGALLKSVEEAQEHAELTSHSNFSESTEAVLNLVCSSCGKPCRSKIDLVILGLRKSWKESDLHTKRTGHTEFIDKTLEAVIPISLEVPKVAKESEEAIAAGSTGEPEEMVVPEVDKKLLEELEAMGFPTARATRALHFSGNTSLEAAVNWVVEHEADSDIDQMPMVPVNRHVEASKPSLTPEEMKLKAQELRLVALRKAEKEEEKRAREKIRQKLEEDKAERRRKLGLPPEEPSAAPKPSAPIVEEKKSALPVRPATKAEQMRECLRSLKQNHKDDDAKVKRAFQTLLTYIGNVARNPDEEKFRKIRLNNQTFQDRVGSVKGGVEFLELCGFEKVEGEEFLFLSRNKVDMQVLNSAGSELNSAINNPFFGVL